MSLSRREFLVGAGLAAVCSSVEPGQTFAATGELPFAASTPISINRVGLRTRNSEALASFYRSVVGLEEISREGSTITLGVSSRALLVLESDPALRADDHRNAGLFHTAFLLPERADLGRWINHAVEKRISVDGASDHRVSEAIYLTDPEGNGVEIYADRSPEQWFWVGGQVDMDTQQMNVDSVRASVPTGSVWDGLPENSIIGHVHLRVGSAESAGEWWQSELGFKTVATSGSDAVFLSTGNYHHHIAANAWSSKGAGVRPPDCTGLSWIELVSKGGQPSEKLDPWGTMIRTVIS